MTHVRVKDIHTERLDRCFVFRVCARVMLCFSEMNLLSLASYVCVVWVCAYVSASERAREK
jgi:hypothetical protein